MKRTVFVVGALAVVVAVVCVVLLGGGKKVKQTPPSSYAFDSLYEDRRGETEAGDYAVAHVEHYEEANYHPLEASPGNNSTHCVPEPPPPSARRLVCHGKIVSDLLYAHAKVTRTYLWKATVQVDPGSGALAVHSLVVHQLRPVVVP
jgi:hypothetical protein